MKWLLVAAALLPSAKNVWLIRNWNYWNITTFAEQLISADYTLDVLLLEFNNGQGFLANGSHCSEFWNVGEQCSIQLKLCVALTSESESCSLAQDAATWIDLGQVSTNENDVLFTGSGSKFNAWSNPLKKVVTGSTYQGFSMALLATDSRSQQVIDTYTVPIADGQAVDDFKYYSHARGQVEPTLFALAWKAAGDLPTPPPTTTTTPATTTTGPTTTGVPTTTQAPTTAPAVPATDCEGLADRTDGVKSILIGGNTTHVYCQYGTTGSYTVIQSRGNKDDTFFPNDVSAYYMPFGKPGVGNNHWLGLFNMNTLTSNGTYNLMIELCCAGATVQQQFYNAFKVGDDSSSYQLSATATGAAVGLAFVNPAGLSDAHTDITAKFSSYESDPDDMEFCDVVHYEGAITSPKQGSGGWWFGSCANNLNGAYISTYANKTKCSIDLSANVDSSGIEMRTSNAQLEPAFDKISYDRVRMAVYSGSIPTGIAQNSFCGAV